jgi:hypothetical protein
VKLGMRDQIARKAEDEQRRGTPPPRRSERLIRRAQSAVGITDGLGRGASGPRLRPVRGQAQMPEYSLVEVLFAFTLLAALGVLSVVVLGVTAAFVRSSSVACTVGESLNCSASISSVM